MNIKKQFICILFILFGFDVFADSSLVVKEIASQEKDNEYLELINDTKKKVCDKLSTSEENVLEEAMYELSYKMYCPIVLIYFEHEINPFLSKTYLCVCFLDKEHKLDSLNIQECNTRNLDEIFILPK
jgi:hypothetical protein